MQAWYVGSNLCRSCKGAVSNAVQERLAEYRQNTTRSSHLQTSSIQLQLYIICIKLLMNTDVKFFI